jgi:hypothetical protein
MASSYQYYRQDILRYPLQATLYHFAGFLRQPDGELLSVPAVPTILECRRLNSQDLRVEAAS